jgi:hypothetical protein
MKLSLAPLNDSDLDALLDSLNTQGREAVYKQPIADMLAASNGNNVSGTVAWSDVNAKADQAKSVKQGDKSPRDVVIAGLKNAAKVNKAGKGRMFFARTPGSETDITVMIRKTAKAA